MGNKGNIIIKFSETTHVLGKRDRGEKVLTPEFERYENNCG